MNFKRKNKTKRAMDKQHATAYAVPKVVLVLKKIKKRNAA